MGEIFDWFYAQIVGFLGAFFAMMGEMGVELFDLPWTQAITLFFSYLALALFLTGVVVAGFECALEYQNGRGNIRNTAINCMKGMMAVGLFTTVPIELYRLCVTLQASFNDALTSMWQIDGISVMSVRALATLSGNSLGVFINLFVVILMGYAILKVFFANLKRGGILLIQIVVGSLYMFSVPRGFHDGFTSWCKQIIGLCLTAFLQTTILVCGLMVFNENILLGLGVMLSSTEIPRIAGAFGLDTSTRGNVMGAVYGVQTVFNIGRQLAGVATGGGAGAVASAGAGAFSEAGASA